MNEDQTPTPARRPWYHTTLKQRRYIYGTLVAAGGVALAYGFDPDQLAAWLVLAAALLGTAGTALANPTRD